MALKWVSALVAAATGGIFVATNVVSASTRVDVPAVVNVVLAAITTASVVLVVVAELHQRIDSRLSVLSDFLVTRLSEISDRLADLESRVADRGMDTTSRSGVLPMTARGPRSRPEN
jgi:hypothetical protein